MVFRHAVKLTCKLNAALTCVCLGMWVWAVLPVTEAEASPALAVDAEHKGIVPFGPYQIFPENRPGNAVYLNNRLVVSVPERAIVQVVPLPKEGRFAYLTQNVFGNAELGVYLPPTDPTPKVKKVAEGFYYVVMVIEGIVYKKLYRIVQDANIVDVLPRSKTADGVVAGEAGVLFYHVAGADTTEQDGRTIYQFRLRLHVLLFQEERLRNLDYPVINTLPRLKLAWKNGSGVEYMLADGRVEVLSLAQFQ